MIDNKNIKVIDKDTIQYHDYTIMRNGKILDKKGRAINKYNLSYPYSHVTLNINGKTHQMNVARLIHSLFYELDNGKRVSKSKTMIFFIDNNTENVAYDNLELVPKSEGFARSGKQTKQDNTTRYFLSRFTKEEAEEIRSKYFTNREKANRNQYNKTSPSVRDLAKEYNCSTRVISKIIKGEYSC